jgi:SAM-dependent methyltransferase
LTLQAPDETYYWSFYWSLSSNIRKNLMVTPSSNREWVYWGHKDPLYAVAVFDGREVGGATPWQAAEFLELGRVYFQDVYQHWVQYGVGNEHCVEIGCGSGRITRQLCERFKRVTAIDVAEGQLKTAAALVSPHATNLELLTWSS